MYHFIEGEELIPVQTVSAMLEAREAILSRAAQVRTLKEELEKILFANTSSSYLPRQVEESFFEPEAIRKYLDYQFWERIITECKLTATMTEKAKNDYLHQIYENPPAFTEKEITALAQNMLAIYGNGIEATVKEVFKQLTNCAYNGGYFVNGKSKRDNCQKIERLFRCRGNILPWWSGGFRFDQFNRYRFNFEDLLKVCYLLEGRGVVPYAGAIKALAEIQLKEGGDTVQCEYFRVVCYANGNHKVTWNDNKIQVLNDLNKYGSSGGLPDIYKKKYKNEHFENPVTKSEAA